MVIHAGRWCLRHEELIIWMEITVVSPGDIACVHIDVVVMLPSNTDDDTGLVPQFSICILDKHVHADLE